MFYLMPFCMPFCMPFAGVGMAFSARQWLASFVLDVVSKFVLIASIFLLFGFANPFLFPFSLMWPAVFLSSFYFVCLFLGYTAAIAFELIGVRFGPAPKFWLGLLFANLLFGIALNIFLRCRSIERQLLNHCRRRPRS